MTHSYRPVDDLLRRHLAADFAFVRRSKRPAAVIQQGGVFHLYVMRGRRSNWRSVERLAHLEEALGLAQIEDENLAVIEAPSRKRRRKAPRRGRMGGCA